MTGTPFGSSSINMDAVYTYDSEGNVTSIQYPNSQFNSNNTTTAGPKYTYGYDGSNRFSVPRGFFLLQGNILTRTTV
jgi:hypothetical protein